MKTLRFARADLALMLPPIALSALFAIGMAWAGSELFTASALSDPAAGIDTAFPSSESAARGGFSQATNIDMFSSPNAPRFSRREDEARAAADTRPGSKVPA